MLFSNSILGLCATGYASVFKLRHWRSQWHTKLHPQFYVGVVFREKSRNFLYF